MKIAVLNGSPKGEVSVTMQYVAYLQKRFPGHQFTVHPVAFSIKRLEQDPAAFQSVMDDVRSSDGVLWAFPLYIMLVCSQYKRFIELIRERGAEDVFRGRYAASLSTSIKFFDHTSNSYIRSISEDLGMKFVGSYSAHMNDLGKEDEQQRLTLFAADYFKAISSQRHVARHYAPLHGNSPVLPVRQAAATVASAGKSILILTDEHGDDASNSNLRAMTSYLSAAWNGARVVNIRNLDIRGGCLGCLRCGQNYECAYKGTDAYVDFYRNEVQRADILVFAGAIVERQLSWKWRQFFDRSFFNTHTPSLTGKQVAFVVAGPLGQLPDVRQIYKAWCELHEANLEEFVSDEMLPDEVFANLDALAQTLVSRASTGYVRPRTFLGIGGMKIFRDEIFGHLRIAFPADHRAYRRRGFYDFPTSKPFTRLGIAFLALLLKIPPLRNAFVKDIKRGMIMAYKRPLQKAVPYIDETRSAA